MTATDSLGEIVSAVETEADTVSIYNFDGPEHVRERIEQYFEPQHVVVRSDVTAETVPKNLIVLHDGDEYRAAAGVREVYEHVDGAPESLSEPDLDPDRPEILEHVDDTTFTGYGMSRMLLASREIERRAWRYGEGELHAGFQQLSRLYEQRSIYEKLRDSGVAVSAYGEPDAELPDGIAPHGYADDEITTTWFVVYDGAGYDEDACAMLAKETADRTFSGFWTYRADVTDRILDRLRRRFPENGRERVDETGAAG